MEFYLNQKSLPMIRKCSSCKHYISNYQSCSLMFAYNAYDYDKKIYMITGDNLYCPSHEFKNEEVLKKEAVVAEFNTVHDAMEAINQAREIKEIKGNGRDNYNRIDNNY